MMHDFEIRFDPTQRGMDMRPPGAKELVTALADFANNDSEQFTTEDAGDAHNYICALEARVTALYYQVLRNQFALKRAEQIQNFYYENHELLKLPPPPPVDPRIFTELGVPAELIGEPGNKNSVENGYNPGAF